jgi:hypothetical protein
VVKYGNKEIGNQERKLGKLENIFENMIKYVIRMSSIYHPGKTVLSVRGLLFCKCWTADFGWMILEEIHDQGILE